jgi:putative ABC transport system substrate-binding protein
VLEIREAEAAARKLGVEPRPVAVRRAEEIAPAFDGLSGADALYVVGDALFNTNRIRLNTLALAGRLATIHSFREIVAPGGLMSYGPVSPRRRLR